MRESRKSKVKSRKTAALKEQRQVTIRRYIFVFILYSLFLTPLFAQSNLTYDLKVGATGDVQVLKAFPESYAGEKVNIRIQTAALKVESQKSKVESQKTAALKDLDFVFVNEGPVEGFDSIYSFTDEAQVRWVVWKNGKEIKNRTQRVLVGNAYNTFEAYLHEQLDNKKYRGWIWWVLAGLRLVGTVLYGGYIVYSRRKERDLTPVERETLRRQRIGMRRHYGSQLYLWLLLMVLYAPIALIAVFSFTKSKVLGNWTGFSMELYANLFTGHADAGLNSAIW